MQSPSKSADTAGFLHTLELEKLRGKRLLVADDDQEIALQIRGDLEPFGVRVDVAYNGKEALDIMERSATVYDLVVLEVLVPKLNGVDVCEAMTKNVRLRKVPVLLTSILPLRSEAFQRSLKKHAEFAVVQGTLEKPFSDRTFMMKIQTLIS